MRVIRRLMEDLDSVVKKVRQESRSGRRRFKRNGKTISTRTVRDFRVGATPSKNV